MPAETERFIDTKTGGFLAGVGIVVGTFLVVRFGGPFIVRGVLTKLPQIAGNKVADAIIHDVVLGRVPVLKLEEAVTLRTVSVSLYTTLFYLFGGLDTMIREAKRQLGIPIEGTGLPHEEDNPNRSSGNVAWRIINANLLLVARMPNMARVDP